MSMGSSISSVNCQRSAELRLTTNFLALNSTKLKAVDKTNDKQRGSIT